MVIIKEEMIHFMSITKILRILSSEKGDNPELFFPDCHLNGLASRIHFLIHAWRLQINLLESFHRLSYGKMVPHTGLSMDANGLS